MIENFREICLTLGSALEDSASTPLHVPGSGTAPTPALIRAAISGPARQLPLAYQSAYVAPLLANLESALARTRDPESLAGVICGHGALETRQSIGRFAAVATDLYSSFLASEKRAQLKLPLIEQLPPLVTFRHEGSPFIWPCAVLQQACDVRVGIVSLPASYRDHTILFGALAHQSSGYDLVRADPALRSELARRLLSEFGGVPGRGPGAERGPLTGLLWTYWLDEALADVYGLLNVGPMFAIDLAALLSTMLARTPQSGVRIPALRTDSCWGDGLIDPHAVDLLRIHLALGVTESLTELGGATRQSYVQALTDLSAVCAEGATTVTIQGVVSLSGVASVQLAETRPLAEMQEGARQIGRWLATVSLDALAGHCLQDLETWSDADEATAQSIAARLGRGHSICGLGDAAHILAGAILALLQQPAQYTEVTMRVNAALDDRFQQDALWGASRARPLLSVGLPRCTGATAQADEPPGRDPHLQERDEDRSRDGASRDREYAEDRSRGAPDRDREVRDREVRDREVSDRAGERAERGREREEEGRGRESAAQERDREARSRSETARAAKDRAQDYQERGARSPSARPSSPRR